MPGEKTLTHSYGDPTYTWSSDNSICTATFSSPFSTQTKDVTINALGHGWGALSYEWLNDYAQCTATRVCTHDASHTESETVNTMYEVTQDPTHYVPGSKVYTADFRQYFGEGAVATSVSVEIPPETLYSVDVYWNGDMIFVFDSGRFDMIREIYCARLGRREI